MISLAHHATQADKVLCLPESHGPTLELENSYLTLNPGSWLLAKHKGKYLFLEGKCRHKTHSPLWAFPPNCEIGE